MSYRALYRKYRPLTFEEVAGQTQIVQTLKNSLKENKIAHAYLFAGPRGTGKTTMARLLAKALNCQNGFGHQCNKCESCLAINEGTHPDVIEIDAASNRGIDDIRDLISKIKYSPVLGKYKVYIIDEVHMMTTEAFNALLKTLEEPPANVVFILATTELQKVPATIISRTQRYNFKRISKEDLEKRMKYILDQENIKYEDKALAVIAQVADGGMRDALSILDQLLSYEKESVNYEDALQITGFADRKNVEQILLKLLSKDAPAALKLAQEELDKGASSKNILDELVDMATKSLMIIKTGDDDKNMFLSEDFIAKIKDVPTSTYYRLITLANKALNDLRYTNQQQIPLEVFLVEATSSEQKQVASAPVANAAPAPAPQQGSTDLSAELAALKNQVVELTQKVQQLSKRPSFAKDQVFQLDTAIPKSVPKAKAKPAEPVKKKPVKNIKKTTAENRKQVYHVLENATRDDLNTIKNVWPDLQSVLAVSERALLDVLEPVAASPDQVVMKCKYTLWFENASSDSDLLEKLTSYIEKFAKHYYGIVLVPDSDWLAVRKEFVESHKAELLAKKKQQIEDKEEADSKEDTEVINKAKDLFGDAVTIKD